MGDLNGLSLDEIKQLPFLGQELVVSALRSQGLSNSAYRITCQGQSYFLKELTSNNFVILDRGSLFELQKKLSYESLAPKPIYLDPDNRFQIDEWVEEGDFANAPLSKEQKLLSLAKILAYTHTRTIEAPRLDLQRSLEHYTQRIKLEANQHLSEQLESFEQQYQQTNESVLCHNDLSLAHCHSSKTHLAFDWEYAAIGNRFFDLASCIQINKLCTDDSELLILFYLRETKRLRLNSRYTDKQVADNIRSMCPIVTFTNDLWMLASKS
jgi:thiamine kinase-like enzyme